MKLREKFKGFLWKKIEGNIFLKVFCYEIDEFLNCWAFWSTNSGGVGGFVAQETKNLKKCDLDLNKWGGYIKGGIYDEYNGIPPCGTIVLEGNFSLPGCFCLWCSTIFSESVTNSSF